MKKQELKLKTEAVINETKVALQILYDALNQGQQKKVAKDPEVATLFERYGIETN